MKELILKGLVLFLFVFTGLTVQAYESVEKELGFIFSPMNFSSGQIYYSSEFMPEEEWAGSRLSESFRPFQGYKSLENYNPTDESENIEVFHSEVAFVTPKAAAQAFLQSKTSLEILNLVDGGFSHTAITADNANQLYTATNESFHASAQQVLLDKKDREEDPITEEQYQSALAALEQQYTLNSGKKWCIDATSTCIKSQLILGKNLAWVDEMVKVIPASVTAYIPIPTGIDLVTEVSNLNNGDANWNSEAVHAIPYTASKEITQTGILANALIQFTKVVVSVHEYAEGQDLVVIQTVVAFEKDDLDDFPDMFGVRSFIMSKSLSNRDEGILMGLPRLQLQMAEKLKTAIETP